MNSVDLMKIILLFFAMLKSMNVLNVAALSPDRDGLI